METAQKIASFIVKKGSKNHSEAQTPTFSHFPTSKCISQVVVSQANLRKIQTFLCNLILLLIFLAKKEADVSTSLFSL